VVVYRTSTTSIYGSAMEPHGRTVWVTEKLVPRPRDIYDVTKQAAEELCRTQRQLRVVVLRTARFFPEPPERIATYRLYRGVDVRDAAHAHVLALGYRGAEFRVFNISARSPFQESDVVELLHDAAAVITRYGPDAPDLYAARGWRLPASIDRVYVIARGERELGYSPRHNFLEHLAWPSTSMGL
jgi:UDP-glucose 4-epimerase